jgi:hypothetical protein
MLKIASSNTATTPSCSPSRTVGAVECTRELVAGRPRGDCGTVSSPRVQSRQSSALQVRGIAVAGACQPTWSTYRVSLDLARPLGPGITVPPRTRRRTVVDPRSGLPRSARGSDGDSAQLSPPHTMLFLAGINQVKSRHLGMSHFGQVGDLDSANRLPLPRHRHGQHRRRHPGCHLISRIDAATYPRMSAGICRRQNNEQGAVDALADFSPELTHQRRLGLWRNVRQG